MNRVPSRPSVDAQLTGHEYQHLVTWCEMLRAVQHDSGVIAMTVEAPDVGNVDDLVIERADKSDTFIQAKHAVGVATPVGTEWLTGNGTSRSLLTRFHGSWKLLSERGWSPDMQLVTDRELDPSDLLMQCLDRKSELLVPLIEASTPPALVAARKEWTDHLNIEDSELFEMLACLRFRTGRSLATERERAQDLMRGLGYVADDLHLDAGIRLVRDWIGEHARRREVAELAALVDSVMQRDAAPAALLVVEAIGDDPHAEDATVRRRFVDLFEGDDDMTRRRLNDQADWELAIQVELDSAATDLSPYERVLVRGPMRQAMQFAVGATLREVRGFTLLYNEHGELWDSDRPGSSPGVEVSAIELDGVGDELAIVINVAASATEDVARYTRDAALPVRRVVAIAPRGGAQDRAVADGPTGVALARDIRDEVRRVVAETNPERLHLFLAGPGALALMLGNRWNGLRQTVVYEHLGVGRGYEPGPTVAA